MKRQAFLLTSLVMLLSAPLSNAQLFNRIKEKVKKGTEKIDKSLEKPAKGIVDGAVGTAKGIFTDPNNPNNKGGVPDNLESSFIADPEKEKELAEPDKTLKRPFNITSGTITLKDPYAPYVIATDVHEGVFAVNNNNQYTFYTISGHKLVEGSWVTGGTREPKMTKEGVIMFKAGGIYGKPMYLIKPDGSVKELPLKYIRATNFVDGLAIVNVKNGLKTSWQFIDENCNIVYPSIHPIPARFDDVNDTNAPLKERMRAFLTTGSDGYGRYWGFMDASGDVVIAPKYQEVRSFSEGLALVKDMDGKVYFIDKKGNKAFDPKWREGAYMQDISNFDSGLCMVEGTMDGEPYSSYYNVKGGLVGGALYGSPFHNGKAYCRQENPDENDPYKSVWTTNVLSKEIEVLGALNRLDDFLPEMNMPVYDELGIAHIGKRNTIGEFANPEYFYDYEFRGFTTDGYAHAEMQTADGSYYKGFIDQGGTFVVIYAVQQLEDSSLPSLD